MANSGPVFRLATEGLRIGEGQGGRRGWKTGVGSGGLRGSGCLLILKRNTPQLAARGCAVAVSLSGGIILVFT